MNYDNYEKTLIKTKLFEGMTLEEIQLAIETMNGRIKKYKKGEIIIRYGDEINSAGLVLRGETSCSLYEPIDRPLKIKYGKEGTVFLLPVSCIRGQKSLIEIEAAQDCEILFLDIQRALERIVSNPPKVSDDSWCRKMVTNLVQELATHAVTLNFRLRIIAHKGIRDRIMLYLSSIDENDDGLKVIPMSMAEFSRFIHVDKSALYKNIREMQDEGILVWNGRKVKLLKKLW